jgi:hypothetical protein
MVAPLPLCLALLALAPAAGEPVLVEEVVAVLRSPAGAPARVITLTRLADECRIVLVSRGAVGAASRPIDAPALRATLDWLIDQTLLSDEAARLQVAEVSHDEAVAELSRFRTRFPDPAAYARFLLSTELSDEEVEAVLSRTLRVARYLETRIGRRAVVGDEEIAGYARDHGLEAGSPAKVEAIRARISEARVEAAVKDLIAELRGRADVRILEPELAREEPATREERR